MRNIIEGISITNAMRAAALAMVAAGAAYAEQGSPQADMEALRTLLGAAQQQAPNAAEVVDARQLRALLPEKIGDMKRTKANSRRNSAMGTTIAEAEGEYSGANDAWAPITLADTVGLGGLGAFAQMEMMAEIDNESDTGYEKTYDYKGVKVYEMYDSEGGSGEISAVAGGRFTVRIAMSNVKPERLKAALDAIDLKKLAGLKSEHKKAP